MFVCVTETMYVACLFNQLRQGMDVSAVLKVLQAMSSKKLQQHGNPASLAVST